MSKEILSKPIFNTFCSNCLFRYYINSEGAALTILRLRLLGIERGKTKVSFIRSIVMDKLYQGKTKSRLSIVIENRNGIIVVFTDGFAI